MIRCETCGHDHYWQDVARVPPKGCPNTSCQRAKEHNHRMLDGTFAGPDDLECFTASAAAGALAA